LPSRLSSKSKSLDLLHDERRRKCELAGPPFLPSSSSLLPTPTPPRSRISSTRIGAHTLLRDGFRFVSPTFPQVQATKEERTRADSKTAFSFNRRSSFSLLPNELVREVILAGIPSQPYPDDRDNFPAARYRARGLVRLARVSKEWKVSLSLLSLPSPFLDIPQANSSDLLNQDICIPLLYQEAIFELSREGEKERLALFWT